MLQMPFGSTNTSEPFDEQVIEAEVLDVNSLMKGCSETFFAAVVDN